MGKEFSAVEPDLRVLLRKAVKKDSTTKTKGLKELQKAIMQRNGAAVSCVWKLWPRIYKKLCLDEDFKVREVSHRLCRELLSRHPDPKNAITSVAYLLFLVEHDPYSVCSDVSTGIIAEHLPGDRRLELMNSCSAEVFEVS
ncbi:unnamed protein product [Soboliphyme baturini]|uniref:E3 ubiquitin-protein ligase listerin n=1 Tax=Soboliphyme baturini TaxID=241478 RepID=A0A183J286_9BILA|nr:unnamed protein product [Soboliphyme baturini]